MPDLSPQPQPDSFAGIQRLARLLVGVLVVTVAVISTVVGASVVAELTTPHPATSSTTPMLAVAPGGVIHPDDVPEPIAVHYRAAHDHPDVFAAVPCFCGCQEMLDHRHLLDCFARPDGSGWEAHAAGCGVCLGEAQQVEDLLAAGVTDSNDIREAVVSQWGDAYQDNR